MLEPRLTRNSRGFEPVGFDLEKLLIEALDLSTAVLVTRMHKGELS